MALFHAILLEFVFIDQLSLIYTKPLTKKMPDIPISTDHAKIVDGVVEKDVVTVDVK